MGQQQATAQVASNSVRLNKKVHALVKEYSEVTGIPVSKVMEVAIEDWMKTVGSVRMDVFRHNQEKLSEMASGERTGGRLYQFRA